MKPSFLRNFALKIIFFEVVKVACFGVLKVASKTFGSRLLFPVEAGNEKDVKSSRELTNNSRQTTLAERYANHSVAFSLNCSDKTHYFLLLFVVSQKILQKPC